MVERLDSPKFETLKTEAEMVQESTNAELVDLEYDIKKPRIEALEKKLKQYQDDPELKSAYKKISDAVIDGAMKDKWKKYENMNVAYVVNDVVKKYPDLGFQLVMVLGLPKSDDQNERVTFKDLSNEKKLRFIALYETIYSTNNYIIGKKIKGKKSLEQVKGGYESNYNKLKKDIEKELNTRNWMNFFTRFQTTKTTLKDCGLTDQEFNKLKEFNEFIEKNKGYFENKIEVQEAGVAIYIKLLIALIVLGGTLAGGIAIGKWLEREQSVFDPDPGLEVDGETPIQIEFTKEVEKLTTLEVGFNKKKEYTLKQYSRENIDRTEGNPIWGPFQGLDKWARRGIKRFINRGQQRHIEIDLAGTFELQYDLEGTKGKLLDDGTLLVETKKPDLVFKENYELKRKVDTEFIALDRFEENEFKEFQNWINLNIKPEYKSTKQYEQAIEKSIFSLLKHYHDEAIELRSPYKINKIVVNFIDTNETYSMSVDDIGKYYDIEIPIADLGADID